MGSREKSEWDERSSQEGKKKNKKQQDAELGMTSDPRTILRRILKEACTRKYYVRPCRPHPTGMPGFANWYATSVSSPAGHLSLTEAREVTHSQKAPTH